MLALLMAVKMAWRMGMELGFIHIYIYMIYATKKLQKNPVAIGTLLYLDFGYFLHTLSLHQLFLYYTNKGCSTHLDSVLKYSVLVTVVFSLLLFPIGTLLHQIHDLSKTTPKENKSLPGLLPVATLEKARIFLRILLLLLLLLLFFCK